MVKHLTHFGLLYTTKIGKYTIFYPTRVAHQLVSGETEKASTTTTTATSTVWSLSNKALETALADPRPSESSHLAIIVQTNFQLCAYTTSELHISMLGLFCDVETIRRLPNVVMMNITRDSVKSAFAFGIQARQILRFLEKHTHPKLRNSTHPIPANVVDQIWLWDRELTRVRFTKVYQHQCLSVPEFQAIHDYAKAKAATSSSSSILAWSSERRLQILIEYGYVERMQAFVRQWRAQAASRPRTED
jgi:transcription initiation factor TFIIH subunit 4